MDFLLHLTCDDDVFGDGRQDPKIASPEVARLLRLAADQVADGREAAPLVDADGNIVGEFRFDFSRDTHN